MFCALTTPVRPISGDKRNYDVMDCMDGMDDMNGMDNVHEMDEEMAPPPTKRRRLLATNQQQEQEQEQEQEHKNCNENLNSDSDDLPIGNTMDRLTQHCGNFKFLNLPKEIVDCMVAAGGDIDKFYKAVRDEDYLIGTPDSTVHNCAKHITQQCEKIDCSVTKIAVEQLVKNNQLDSAAGLLRKAMKDKNSNM